MNNFTVANPYTSKIPGGTLNKVQFVVPQSIGIQIPNRSGHNLPSQPLPSFLRTLFG